MDLTDIQKRIYNTHLSITRSIKNKPFKYRQDFTNIDSKTEVTLKKLSYFFSKYPNISYADFFTAPYKCYDEQGYFELDFFCTPKAIKCYSLYKEKQETQDPDSDQIIESCKASCKFIFNFCKEKNITLQQYKKYSEGSMPIFLVHLKEHKINFYTLHGLDSDREIKNIEKDILDFFIKDFHNLLNATRINFQRSIKLKHIVRKALDLIEQILLKNKLS